MDRLDGKVAIVTGAGCVGPGWGNGRAITVRFAQEGARVFAVDKDAGSDMTHSWSFGGEKGQREYRSAANWTMQINGVNAQLSDAG